MEDGSYSIRQKKHNNTTRTRNSTISGSHAKYANHKPVFYAGKYVDMWKNTTDGLKIH